MPEKKHINITFVLYEIKLNSTKNLAKFKKSSFKVEININFDSKLQKYP